MNIVYLTDDYPPEVFGGAGVIAYNIARKMAQMGHSVTVVTAIRSRASVGESIEYGVRIIRIYTDHHERWRAYYAIYNPMIIRSLKKVLAELKPDVVHAHNVHQHLSYHSLKLAKKYARRVILTAHDTMHYSYGKVYDDGPHSSFRDFLDFRLRFNPLRNLFIKYYLSYVDLIVSVSRALQRALRNNGIPSEQVIHNGIDLESFGSPQASVEELKKKYNLGGKKVVLFCGRLSGAKGGGVLARAMSKVQASIPEAMLLVAGMESGYATTMKQIGDEEHLKNIVFTGWLSREAMATAYQACDLVVVPSIYLDPFPTVNLEAMAAHKPVVGTCFGGTPEIVANGETGYIVDPRDIGVLASRIQELLSSSELAQAMGERGYERVQAHFDLGDRVKEYIKLY